MRLMDFGEPVDERCLSDPRLAAYKYKASVAYDDVAEDSLQLAQKLFAFEQFHLFVNVRKHYPPVLD